MPPENPARDLSGLLENCRMAPKIWPRRCSKFLDTLQAIVLAYDGK